MITPEQHAEIRRLYYGEHWKVGTIAAALGVHHETVRAALVNDTQGLRRSPCRATRLDPYLPLIRDTLAQYPRLRATRLFDMVKGRGYQGSVVQLGTWSGTLRGRADEWTLWWARGVPWAATSDVAHSDEILPLIERWQSELAQAQARGQRWDPLPPGVPRPAGTPPAARRAPRRLRWRGLRGLRALFRPS